ncbi:M23 family metallopeptidase [Stenotrophobium rhamnosiphilum]|nr:M23 family metallopeptidase [Stenotrophobium rhamnosiphilum]
MDIIVVSKERGRTWRFHLHPRNVLGWLPLATLVALICVLCGTIGYMARGDGEVLPSGLVAAWAKEATAQREEISQTRVSAGENARALARRIAELQAHVLRLDAAGQRLTQIAGLDKGEFNFNAPPPVGGPEELVPGQEPVLGDVLTSLDSFEKQLTDRERQMRVLEDLLLASRLQQKVRPSGWPIADGWISSTFGTRTDPFTGRYANHYGIDFAARNGSDVLSVATGIVTDAGERSGYGILVEINHGNGYVTRYGHNQKALVRVGDKVNKGQRIALMGSTGRSTGPHVHFEVLFNGALVNPEQYIQASH